MKTLHIYAQESWHDEAYIVGDRAALVSLRNAINEALEKGWATTPTDDCVFTNDGEGYVVHVHCVSDQDTLERLALPYTEPMAQESNPTGRIWPHTLSKKS